MLPEPISSICGGLMEVLTVIECDHPWHDVPVEQPVSRENLSTEKVWQKVATNRLADRAVR